MFRPASILLWVLLMPGTDGSDGPSPFLTSAALGTGDVVREIRPLEELYAEDVLFRSPPGDGADAEDGAPTGGEEVGKLSDRQFIPHAAW